MQLKKKILKVLIIFSILTLLISTTLIPVSAEFGEGYYFTNVYVGNKSYQFSVMTADRNGMSFDICQPVDQFVNEAEFHFNTPADFKVGDIVEINFIAMFSMDVKQVEIFLGSQSWIKYSNEMGILEQSFDSLGNVTGNRYFTFSQKIEFTSNNTQPLVIIVRNYTDTAILGISNFSFSLNNDPAVATQQQTNQLKENQDKNTDKIIANDDKNTDKIINPDFGYEKPPTANTDDGIEAADSLIDSLTDSVDNFNKNLDNSVNNILSSIQPFKNFVHKLFDVFPPVVQYLITFAVVFLVLRKVVGR